jgi:hypothetical protein
MTAKARQAPALPPERASFGERVGGFFYMLYAGLMTALGWIAEPLQRWISMKNMAYFFVLPNLLIFGIFVLFPMMLNIYYSSPAAPRFSRRTGPSSARKTTSRSSPAPTFSTPIPAARIASGAASTTRSFL